MEFVEINTIMNQRQVELNMQSKIGGLENGFFS
jgi:hypothetical protein